MTTITPRDTSRRLRLGVLVSGGGRTLQYLDEACRRTGEGSLFAEIACCIASGNRCYALERAKGLGVPASVVRPRDFPSEAEFSAAIFDSLDAHRVDLAILAGYLVKLPIAVHWRGRVMNIHPALLPSFGGKGYFGHHVHDAVRKSGVKVTGCTVHFVDDEYDHGPIIVQRAVPVAFEDDSDAIAANVFAAESLAYVEAIALYQQDKLRIDGGRVRIVP